jgi:hypothetical protein
VKCEAVIAAVGIPVGAALGLNRQSTQADEEVIDYEGSSVPRSNRIPKMYAKSQNYLG